MNPGVRARIKTRRELARRGYTPIYEELREILVRHNPAGLEVNRGDVQEDYGGPVGTLIPKLEIIRKEQVSAVLYEEMISWYGKLSGGPESYPAIAQEIWDAWTKFKQSNSPATRK